MKYNPPESLRHKNKIVKPKALTEEDMLKDIQYYQAQKALAALLSSGLISLVEFNKITQQNRDTFSPYLVEIMPDITWYMCLLEWCIYTDKEVSTIKKVTKIETAKRSPSENRKLRVAAYARVSTDSDAQLESLEAQKSHYESYIRSRDDWEFAGLYYDEGITGTKAEKRP